MTNTNYGYGYGGYGQGLYGNPPIENLPLGSYLSLITSEYQSSSKFLAWMAAPLSILTDLSTVLAGFVTAFDPEYAIGPQLDLLGEIIGQPRTISFQPSGGVSPTLDDPTYRLLLKARIAQNSWDGTIDSLQTIWITLFAGGHITIADNQNMTASILLSGSFSSIIQDLITNGYIVPRPEGVLYNFVFGTFPVFGFDVNNSFVAGFNTGHFS